MAPIRVVHVDDHSLFREGMKSILSSISGVEWVGDVGQSEGLMEIIPQLKPDIILLDLQLPGKDGIKLCKEIKTLFPEVKVVILSMYNEERIISHLMELGANGYLTKTCKKEEMERALKEVSEKGFYFGEMVSKAMLSTLKDQRKKSPVTIGNDLQLTKREQEILELVYQEFTTNEIAEKLFISSKTVEGHRKNLMEKLGVKNTAGLIKIAIQSNLIDSRMM